MIPPEFLVSTVAAVGITIPVATIIEFSHPPADMTSYEVRANCEVGDAVLERCLFDVKTGTVVGSKF